MIDVDKLSEEFLQIASHLRLGIILHVAEQKSNLSTLSKKLNATTSEMHRNLGRLVKANLIQKDSSGKYGLTTYGKMVFSQISSWDFVTRNLQYFSKHSFGNLSNNFIQSIGALNDSKHVRGFVNVQDVWKSIYKNSKQYVFNILFEVSYDSDILDIITTKIKTGVVIHSIFSKKAIISEKRKAVVSDPKIKDAIREEKLQRKISDVNVLVVLNENEGCIMFPYDNGDVDVSEAFYGNTTLFHDWISYYFQQCWNNSGAFYEERLKS